MSRKALENTNEMCSCPPLDISQYSLNRIKLTWKRKLRLNLCENARLRLHLRVFRILRILPLHYGLRWSVLKPILWKTDTCLFGSQPKLTINRKLRNRRKYCPFPFRCSWMQEMCKGFETDDNLMVCARLPGQLKTSWWSSGISTFTRSISRMLSSIYSFYALLLTLHFGSNLSVTRESLKSPKK